MDHTKQLIKDSANYAKDIDIFDGLTDGQILCVAKSSRGESIGRDTLIYSPKDPLEDIYVLHRGEVQLYHLVRGKKVVFDVLTPGAVFGAFDPDQKHPNHYAEVMRDAELCVTPKCEFLKLVSAHPEMLLRLFKRMAQRIHEYEQKLEVCSGTAEDKLLYELKRQKQKRSQNFLGKIFAVQLRLTHEQLAKLTGLNRITVTRTLKQLKEDHKISIDEKTGGIEVLD